MGIDKTIARVSERYGWPKFRSSVRKYVLSCNYCQFHKCTPVLPVSQLQPIAPPDRPFHKTGTDLGPFKTTRDRKLQPFAPPDRPFHTIGTDLGPFKTTRDGKNTS